MKTARYMVERASNIVWDLLEEVIADHPVLSTVLTCTIWVFRL